MSVGEILYRVFPTKTGLTLAEYVVREVVNTPCGTFMKAHRIVDTLVTQCIEWIESSEIGHKYFLNKQEAVYHFVLL